MILENITLGADPELFLCNDSGMASAEGTFGGTKAEPKKLNRKGFSIQEDNVAVEFNIPPASTLQEFQDNIEFMIDYIKIGANQFDCRISKAASADFDPKLLQTEQAQTFGCDPDYNAYTMDRNAAIIMDGHPNMRTCGGHIHIGYDEPNDLKSIQLIRALDITLGLPSLLRDPDKRRRSMYGKAGAYRIQPFGVEYRTLSNFWIFSKEEITWVYNGVMMAVELVNSNALSMLAGQPFIEAVPNVINKGNEVLAKNLIGNISRTLKQQTVCVDS